MDNNKDLFFHTGGGVDINQDFLPIGTSTEKFVAQHFLHAGGWNYRQSGFLDAQSFADLAGSLLFGQSRRRLLSVVVIHQVARAVIFHDFPIVQSHRHLDEIGVKGDIVLGKGILNGADVVIDHIIAFRQILDAVFLKEGEGFFFGLVNGEKKLPLPCGNGEGKPASSPALVMEIRACSVVKL